MALPLRLAWLLPVVAITACSAQNCDPNTTGFFSGIGCEIGPGYAANQKSLENSLATARQNLAASRASATAAAAEAASAQDTLAMMRGQLARMRDDNVDLRRRVNEASHRVGVSTEQVALLRARLDAQDAALRQNNSAPNQATMTDLQRKQKEILDAINAMSH